MIRLRNHSRLRDLLSKWTSTNSQFPQNNFRIIACRPIGARSSPAPSVDAELSGKFANYACGVEKGNKLERKGKEYF